MVNKKENKKQEVKPNFKKAYEELSKLYKKWGTPMTIKNCRKLPKDKDYDKEDARTVKFYVLTNGYTFAAYYSIADERRFKEDIFDANSLEHYWYIHFPVLVLDRPFFPLYIAHHKNVCPYFLTKETFIEHKEEIMEIEKKYGITYL